MVSTVTVYAPSTDEAYPLPHPLLESINLAHPHLESRERTPIGSSPSPHPSPHPSLPPGEQGAHPRRVVPVRQCPCLLLHKQPQAAEGPVKETVTAPATAPMTAVLPPCSQRGARGSRHERSAQPQGFDAGDC